MAMEIGDTLQVNNGEIETLIKIERPFGLFKAKTYQCVRSLARINDRDVVTKQPKDNNCLKYRLIREQMILNERAKEWRSERAMRIKKILATRYELF